METKEIAWKKLNNLLVFVFLFGFLFSWGIVVLFFTAGEYIRSNKISSSVIRSIFTANSAVNFIGLYLYLPFIYLAVSILKKRKALESVDIISKYLIVYKYAILGIIIGTVLLFIFGYFIGEASIIFITPFPYIIPFIGLFIGKLLGRIIAKFDEYN